MKTVTTIIIFICLGCVAFNQALQCYTHDECLTNCPHLSTTIQTCSNGDNKCYKAAFLGGIRRGCAKDRCNVQINANSIMANVCCDSDLCNSAMLSTFSISIIFITLSFFFYFYLQFE